MSQTELDDWFKAYVLGKPLDAYTNKITGGSVMDYDVSSHAFSLAGTCAFVKEALPHDHAAIGWGYFDSNEARTNKILFGTDDDMFHYSDVRAFDYGDDPVVSAYSRLAQIWTCSRMT